MSPARPCTFPVQSRKSPGGETSGARAYYKKRNAEIRESHQAGADAESLAELYHLSLDSIRKILR